MAHFFARAGLVALGLHGVLALPPRAVESGAMHIMDQTPNMPFDPNTIATCTWWWDNDGSISCKNMPAEWGISMDNFLAWNPSITADCGNFLTGRSYCVEAPAGGGGPGPTTTSAGPTTTSTGNGVSTPTPTQPDMVDNCNKFYLVKMGDSCDSIARSNGVSSSDFVSWNPSVGDTCSGLWANAYVCVGIIGGSTTISQKPTTTTAGNGITTPTPTQPDMVNNCDAFYFVKQGDNCDTISRNHGISRAQFVSYNPSVGDTCSGMWANVYVCVSIIGSSPTTSQKPTTTGNGIATPTPTQPDMITDCNKFYLVKSGDNCAKIATSNNISQTQLLNWNPSVGADCSGLWANAYVCVGRIGTPTTPPKTTTTTSGNGIATPTPIQDGMVKNCNRFHFVTTGNTCQSIATRYSITVAQFTRWNPAVGSGCTSLWGNTYACVGVVS